MAAENITAWFSYAGEQHPLVTKVCDYLKPPAVEAIVQEAAKQLTKISEDLIKDVRLQPKRYRLDENDDATAKRDPIYRLAPGCNINELTRDIANNPIRIMVLSEDYFKSQPCLEELCLSLCANQNDGKLNYNRLPMLILEGLQNNEVLIGKTFEFADATTKAKSQTLLEALTQTHKSLNAKFTSWRGFDLSDEFRQKLPEILNQLSDQVYVRVPDDGERAAAVAIYRYAFSYLSCVELDSTERLIKTLYENWGEYEFAKILQPKINVSDNKETVDCFLPIKNIDQAKKYFNKVHNLLNKDRSLLKAIQSEKVVYELYALVMLKCLKPIRASLLSELGSIDSIIDVNVANDTDINLANSIQATLSFCTATGFAPQINTNADAKEIDGHQMTGTIFPRKTTISGKSYSECHVALKELGRYLAPFDPLPDDNHLSNKESKEYKDYIDNIRVGLQNLDTGEYGLLVLNVSNHRSKDGYFPLLDELERLINYNHQDEKLSLPCVILRAESTKKELLFPEESFKQFRYHFQRISKLYSEVK